MKLKLNTALRGHDAGVTINVPDADGTPLDSYWRRRLRDAPRDNCVTVVSPRQKKADPVKPKESDNDDNS